MLWIEEWMTGDLLQKSAFLYCSIPLFFFIPAEKTHHAFPLYCAEVDQIKAALELQSFIATTFLFVHSFSTDDILHLFPSNGVFLGSCVHQSLKEKKRTTKKHSTHKVRSYQSCPLLSGNKLVVTFWVHCSCSAAGLSVILVFIFNS